MRRFVVGVIGAALALAPMGVTTAAASAATGHKQGATGETVRTIQYLLTARGFAEPADGIYGKDTTATVKRFQKANKLAVDGSVGTQTWMKLIVEVRRGSKGSAVTALQRQLRFRWGYKSVAADGVFGAATQTAVKDFQTKKKLTADGIVGAGTWKALVS